MRFTLYVNMQEALTFDDVLLAPQYSNILPKDTNTETILSRNITIKIPIVSSPMDTVTEHRLAIVIALEGGIGIIHKNLTPAEQSREVEQVKRFENGFIIDPITVESDNLTNDVYSILKEKKYGKIPVVDKNKKLVGVITKLDYLWPDDKNKKISSLMTPTKDLVTAQDGISLDKANKLIQNKKLSILCVIDKQGRLKSMVTRKDLEKNKNYPNANKDAQKRLRVGAAIGVGKDMLERAYTLADAGVDLIVIDTAHGHSEGVINATKLLKKDKRFKNIDIIAGNIATREGAAALIKAGADGIKVGVGPGSICTTRVIAGIGIPQITAIMEANIGRGKNKKIPIIADGGIKSSGDIVKALAAGADSVMLGGMLAGTEESPGATELYNGRMYKVYRGMGSISAMQKGSRDRYGQADVTEAQKLVPEGIEGKVPYRGAAENIIYQLVGGIRTGMGYNGAKTIKELQTKAKFIRITNAGFRESHPHDVKITKEAPNYFRG